MRLAISKGACGDCGNIEWLYLHQRKLRCSHCMRAEDNREETARILGIGNPFKTPYDVWYKQFQDELALQSGTGVIPRGMSKESFRESYIDGLSPADRAAQELDDLSR